MAFDRAISSEEIRETFLRYFEEQNHQRIRGSLLVPKNDPTLLFINAGMAPLKPYFTGEAKPPHPDLCNVQPCIRTRDIDDVGDRHHLTFFEMLGSWSIGNYFKERAIELAFELLVGRFGFRPDQLFSSVYGGNPALGLPPDEVSIKAWERVGMAPDRIVVLGEDNFWGPPGETGPCGPCTEVFFDCGEAFGPTYTGKNEFDTKRYIEIWNAGVFMQYFKKADGSYEELPFTSVDTGSGLERMTMVMNNKTSVYETDLLGPVLEAVHAQFGQVPTVDAAIRGHRRIADHLRASTFILSEGVAPSNEGRGYIPRRLIRKCVALAARAGIRFDYAHVVDQIITRFGEAYPHLRENRDRTLKMFTRETGDFESVIERGLKRLDGLTEGKSGVTIGGKDAFSLFATFGMPIDLIRDFAKEREGQVDEEGYAAEYRHHQEVSRATPKHAEGVAALDEAALAEVLAGTPTTAFVGYDHLTADAKIQVLVVDGAAAAVAEPGAHVDVVLDVTPFYAECGGQVADHGRLVAEGVEVRVLDTQSVGAHRIHRCEVVRGVLRPELSVKAEVEVERRLAIAANHSATHLMHAALRSVLGEHVRQAGSLVEPGYLRFDFHHPAKVTEDELLAIEKRVNRQVAMNVAQVTEELPYDQALARGALAFFGDTYGENVRMVQLEGCSTELCGGVHVQRSGDIGLFRIVSEGSVARGIRRIVAFTREKAVEHTLAREAVLKEVAGLLNVGLDGVVERIQKLQERPAKKPAPVAAPADLTQGARVRADGLPFVLHRVTLEPGLLRDEATKVADQIHGLACLYTEAEGKAHVVVAVDNDKTAVISAGDVLGKLLVVLGGRGGGKSRLAQGGGPKVEALSELPAAFEAALGL